jgi:hypothetical protein
MSTVERRYVDVSFSGYPIINLEGGVSVFAPKSALMDDLPSCKQQQDLITMSVIDRLKLN